MPRKTVLIVEDDADISLSLQQLLEIEGYQAVIARNGRDAIEHLQKGMIPGLILLDIMMPIMDGWQFLAAKRELIRAIDIPVIVMSAAKLIEKVVLERDVVAALKKPIDVDELIRLLEEKFQPG